MTGLQAWCGRPSPRRFGYWQHHHRRRQMRRSHDAAGRGSASFPKPHFGRLPALCGAGKLPPGGPSGPLFLPSVSAGKSRWRAAASGATRPAGSRWSAQAGGSWCRREVRCVGCRPVGAPWRAGRPRSRIWCRRETGSACGSLWTPLNPPAGLYPGGSTSWANDAFGWLGSYPRYPRLPWEPCGPVRHLAAGTSAC